MTVEKFRRTLDEIRTAGGLDQAMIGEIKAYLQAFEG